MEYMNPLFKKVLLVLVFFILVSISSYFLILDMISPDFDMKEKPTIIIDGYTFNTTGGNTIRLADLKAPEINETGYDQAKDYLQSLILNETVFLDVDDIHRWDTSGIRLVCISYVSFNSTHYINVNKALLVKDYAFVWDYENEFNPSNWSLYIRKFSEDTRNNIILVSALIGTLLTIVIVIVIRSGYRFIQLQFDKTKRWIKGLKDRKKTKKEISDIGSFDFK